MTLTEPGAAHRSLVAQNASPPRLPSPDCERSIVGGHAILRAFFPVFRAARGFFRPAATFFLVLPAALTGDANSSWGCFAARWWPCCSGWMRAASSSVRS
jgi:hypothetical protein